MSGEEFDRMREREEDEGDIEFSATLVAQELGTLKSQRACVFVADSQEVLHGQLSGVLKEMDVLVMRDLRPTRQLLRAKLLIPVEKIEHICINEDRTKCKTCHIYAEIEADMKGTDDAKTDQEPGQGLRNPGGAPGDRPADQVGAL